jgi:hypothetical protein
MITNNNKVFLQEDDHNAAPLFSVKTFMPNLFEVFQTCVFTTIGHIQSTNGIQSKSLSFHYLKRMKETKETDCKAKRLIYI